MCDFSGQRRSSYTSRVWVMHYITSIQFYFAACLCQQSVTICLGVTANLTPFDLWVAQLEAMSLPVQHLFCNSGSDLIDRIWMTLGQAKRPRVAMEQQTNIHTNTAHESQVSTFISSCRILVRIWGPTEYTATCSWIPAAVPDWFQVAATQARADGFKQRHTDAVMMLLLLPISSRLGWAELQPPAVRWGNQWKRTLGEMP